MWSPRQWSGRANSLIRHLGLEKITWKTIILLAVCGRILKYLGVISYCFLCHTTFYQWTSCMNDEYQPKSFANLSTNVLTSASRCRGTELALVYVPSTFSQFRRRQLIRETWAKSLHKDPLKAKFVFVLGAPALGQSKW